MRAAPVALSGERSLQVSAACRDRRFRCGLQNSWREDALDRVAGSYKLAACVLRN